jgi:sulfur-oxidizing protein SoxB
MELNEEPLDANKKYAVAGWASVTEGVTGPKIWDVMSDYLRDKKTISIKELNIPEIESMKGNPGMG